MKVEISYQEKRPHRHEGCMSKENYVKIFRSATYLSWADNTLCIRYLDPEDSSNVLHIMYLDKKDYNILSCNVY